MFITFVLLHMLFLITVIQFKMATFMFMGTLLVRIKHSSFGHMQLPSFFGAYLCEKNWVV
ncbi:hypothetical protein AB205_0096490 [Aquarana catesbeiana]|uniref:Uncharacterized protein n=1 Tax=Aquarana catesbeiana TaxID=8400 RepID=A0A2G9P8J5_AQUCT|nr:hypothetical protein AB205_0096490 [Aquarana catesbeiana]